MLVCAASLTRTIDPAPTFALHVQIYDLPHDLPPDARGLFDDASEGNIFRSYEWLSLATPHGLQPGDRLRLFLLQGDDGRAVALMPAVYSRLYASHPMARVLHFLQREERPFEPIGRSFDAEPVVNAIAAWLRENPKSVDVLRASPLDPALPFTAHVLAAVRRSGYWTQLYRHAPSRYARVAGLTFSEYLAQRPRALRESLDLNTRLLMQGGRGEFHFPCSPELVEDAWESVRYVIDRAPEEDAPDSIDYLRAVLDTASACGALRLGIFSLDGVPVAVQLWVVSERVARCLRIWGAQGQRTFPIDDVLTQLVTLCLIDGDHVEELEFGDVNEAFAADWAPMTRDRLGLAAFNRRTGRGIRGAFRHIGLQLLLAAPRRMWRKILGRA